MKKYLAAVGLAAVLAQPASAVTFSKLTTIYVGTGIYDAGVAAEGFDSATSINCANVSGVAVQVRILILNSNGTIAATHTRSLSHGNSFIASTDEVVFYGDFDTNLNVGVLVGGVLNIEATNSGIFCSAIVIDADNVLPTFTTALHLVRVNPHPGTVE